MPKANSSFSSAFLISFEFRMAFYGGVVKGNKSLPWVPSGEPGNSIIHLSQASVPATVSLGARFSLQAKFGGADAPAICLASFTAGSQVSCA